jgi:hypothetical protein
MSMPLGRRSFIDLPVGRFKVFDNGIRNYVLFVLGQ